MRKALYVATAVLTSSILIRIFLLDSFLVVGNSMAPYLVEGDYVFVDKTAYWFSKPDRGDVVVGNFRDLEGKKIIKRVVGLPGEWLFIENGNIYVSSGRDSERTLVGELDQESFTSAVATSSQYRLDPHEYYLIGDNGLSSVDSRVLGPVDIYKIDGRVLTKIRFN